MTIVSFYRRLPIFSGIAVAALLCFPAHAQMTMWEDGGTIEMGQQLVSLSRPRLVQRSKGFLWFPSMYHRSGSRLFAIMSAYADQAQDVTPGVITFSDDGGLTWSSPVVGNYGEMVVARPDGSFLLLPYYLRFKSDDLAVGQARQIPKKTNSIEAIQDPVEVSGWPRKIGLLDADLGGPKPEWKLASFVFNGQSLVAKDGKTYLATLYGRFAGTRRFSVVLAESADGLKWQIRSVIADETCKLRGHEGPCESAIVRLKDDRLLCVFRLDSGVPYGHCFSSDDGKNWTEPKNLDGPLSVQPSLALSSKGILLLSGGRPGLFVWLNHEGDAVRWDKIDLQAHHNKWVQDEPIASVIPAGNSGSTAYTEVRWLDDRHFLVIYDRLANGWQPISGTSTATNSVWVVRGRLEPLNTKRSQRRP